MNSKAKDDVAGQLRFATGCELVTQFAAAGHVITVTFFAFSFQNQNIDHPQHLFDPSMFLRLSYSIKFR